MKFLQISNGREIRVSDEDYDHVRGFTWAQFRNGRVYRKEPLPPVEGAPRATRTILLHRQIAQVTDSRKVIFRDGDSTNCTRENLVIASESFQPRQRIKKPGSSAYRGVGWNRAKSMWQAFLRVNGKLKHLGFFSGDDAEKRAAQAYDNAALEKLGELAILNFPKGPRRRPAGVAPVRPQIPTVRHLAESRAPATQPKRPERELATVPAGGGETLDPLFQKPVQDLTPDEMETLKARFLGERYRARKTRT